jgi:PAS domain S-box-containing protein
MTTNQSIDPNVERIAAPDRESGWSPSAAADRLRMGQEHRYLVTAINQVAESIVVTDDAGVIEYVNPAFTRLTGYTQDEVLGHKTSLLKSGQHDSAFYAEMWNTLTDGRAWAGRMINRRKSGELFHEEAIISPVTDSSGRITHFVAVKRDVTHELELVERLQHSQKMEAVGTLAGGVAHDFNNILYALLGYVDLALDDLPPGHPARASLTEIARAGNRAANLVAKMLTFGRRGGGQREVIGLETIVAESLDLVRASMPASIRIERDLPDASCLVKADPSQLQQVLLNLCANALHAMGEDGGQLHISVDQTVLDGESSAPWARLRVADTGCGIDPALMKRIFEPYVTTRASQEGTGLGLASVHGIVTSHGGLVSACNLPAGGAEFTVLLPLVTGHVDDCGEMDHGGPAGGGRKARIMVVDDEPMVAQVLERALLRSGFQVSCHADGAAALADFRANPAAYDAVVTDLTMPHMSGLELAGRLYELRPSLSLILTTGYCDEAGTDRAREAGIRHFMAKPVKLRELIENLMEMTGTVTKS